jgi:hypothetical protein
MAIEYTIPAIPTEYEGRIYRSRLEAKWAAFFDMCGWKAEYEPYDLGSWSPDFLIKGRYSDILVEVKPITALDFPTVYKMYAATEQTGFKGDLLLVGAAVFSHTDLGWVCSNMLPEGLDVGRERFGLPAEMQMIPWFVPAETLGSTPADITIPWFYKNTRSGVPEGRGMIWGINASQDRYPLNYETTLSEFHAKFSLMRTWRAASNRVQWHGHR